MRRPRIFAALLLALLAAATDPATARADDVDKRAAELGQFLGRGAFEFASSSLEAGGAETLKGRPKAVRSICDGLDAAAGQVSKENVDKARKCAEAITDLAKECAAAAPEDADALWSLGAARLFRGRIERAFGTPDAADWTDAADLFTRSWRKLPDGGRAAGDAASAWFEAARLPGAAAAEYVARADQLLDEALKAHPDSSPILRSWGMRQIDRAAAASKKSEAKAILEAALARVGPLANRPEPDIDAATVWNEIATINIAQKIGMKAPYVARTVPCGASLDLKVPVSRYFSAESDSEFVHQFDRDFRKFRTIAFRDYSWSTAYDFGAKGYGSIGGDNAKGIAMGAFFDAKNAWADPKVAKEPAKKSLNARITGALMWEISGVRDAGSPPQRERGWVWKSDKGWQTTLALVLYEWVPAEIDPAMDFVLDSVTERSRK